MIKDLQVTIYEITGYLLPGLAFLLALLILFWALFYPGAAIDAEPSAAGIWTGLFAAYVAGHVAQSLGNFTERAFGRSEDLVLGEGGELPGQIREVFRVKLAQVLGVDVEGLPPRWLYRLCDDALVHAAKVGERELYVYREGFYRGMFVALATLAIATGSLAVRIALAGAPRSLNTWGLAVGPLQLIFLSLLFGSGSWLLYRRYRRFASYRVTHAVLGFLSLYGGSKPSWDDSKTADPNSRRGAVS